MALEHHFGKEIETSTQQLFNYFCNHIYLGQWQAAKACLKQLFSSQAYFKFDLSLFVTNLIENPELYM